MELGHFSMGPQPAALGFSKRMQPRIDELARRTQQFYRYFAVLKIDDTRNDVP